MSRVVLLDSTPLGDLSRPDAPDPMVDWVEGLTAAGTRVAISEIADYEVRRELLLARKSESIARLDNLKRDFVYVAITTTVMLVAAELWAQARRAARPS